MVDTQALRHDRSNADQLRAWDGDEGTYWAEHADRFDATMAAYHRPLLDAAAIRPGDSVLDVGCGTGQVTRDAARAAGSGSALGVDLSGRMIEVARAAAEREGVGNARFEQADAQVEPFPRGAFDVAVSRTGAMFFGDPRAAFANVAAALRPGGRLALLVWQPLDRNEWALELFRALAAGRELPAPPPDAPGPFSLGDPARVERLLAGAGFTAVRIEARHGSMVFGSDPEDAQRFVLGLLGWMVAGVDDGLRRRALDGLRATLEAHRTGQGVAYGSAAWLVTARRPV